jgi:protein-tyrosine phosphatase
MPVAAQESPRSTGSVTPLNVLFVCMGNICRSPTAHGVMDHMLRAAGLDNHCRVDSAGTHNYQIGAAPDARSQQHATRRGYDLSSLRARQIEDADFDNFDLILAMDWDNLALIQAMAPPQHLKKVRRLAEFFQTSDATVVPDPYYGGASSFEDVLDLVEDGCRGLLVHVQKRLA